MQTNRPAPAFSTEQPHVNLNFWLSDVQNALKLAEFLADVLFGAELHPVPDQLGQFAVEPPGPRHLQAGERYVAHFVKNRHQLLVAAHLAPLEDPVPPGLPHAVVGEAHGEAVLAAERVGLGDTRVVPDGSAGRRNQQELQENG